jgi:acetyl esterase/lipase
MRYLRENGEEFKVTTGIIGVMGFSAGGHLASTVATHTFGDEAPAFQILFYPVITMDASYTHSGSRTNLLGSSPSASLVELYSNEKQVKATTPMAYLCWADNDGTVAPKNSLEYIKALQNNGVPVRTKNFTTGGHGYGYGLSYSFHDEMIADLADWMKSIDETLTIDAPAAVDTNAEVYYDLSGRRVDNPKRGIFITKGRKIFVK